MSTAICLVVVFNHRFEKNLSVLRRIYASRFNHVVFIMPFYQGKDPDVVPVFESSATFQGYLAQAQRHFIRPEFSHYIFVADDILLNPALNESNVLEAFQLKRGAGYIKSLTPISSATFAWPHFYNTLKAFQFNNYVNAAAELPKREEALERMARHDLHFTRLGWTHLRTGPGPLLSRIRNLALAALLLFRPRGIRDLRYPLLIGYADLIIVPSESIEEFCHSCGVFAAMGIFVECAAPTALALSVSHLVYEKNLTTEGKEIWNDEDKRQFGEHYNLSLTSLFQNFPPNTHYVHPIKLSQWNQ